MPKPVFPDARSSFPDPTGASADERSARHERRLQFLLDRLPNSIRHHIVRLRQPSARRLRIPAGAALVVAGLLAFLPVLGVWMLPLGLALLAEDVAPLKRLRGFVLDWIAERRPQWLGEPPQVSAKDYYRLNFGTRAEPAPDPVADTRSE